MGEITSNDKEPCIRDSYGIIGLLNAIQSTDSLTLGADLTTLGLHLNSSEPLSNVFYSPFMDGQPPKEIPLVNAIQSMDRIKPSTNTTIFPDFIQLPTGLLNSFLSEAAHHLKSCSNGPDDFVRSFEKLAPEWQRSIRPLSFDQSTLFYCFYFLPDDIIQLLAIISLLKSGWIYIKPTFKWIKLRKQSELANGKVLDVIYYDHISWSVKTIKHRIQIDQLLVPFELAKILDSTVETFVNKASATTNSL